MRLGIYAERQPGYHGQRTVGEIPGQGKSCPSPVRSGCPGTDDGNRRHAEQFRPAENVQNRRRIGEFSQQWRITGIFESERNGTATSQARQFPFTARHYLIFIENTGYLPFPNSLDPKKFLSGSPNNCGGRVKMIEETPEPRKS
jgi:hypothetical protein